jgi:transcriptional regulator with XRE-family HTH domain
MIDLRSERQNRGLTLREAAKEMDVDFTALQRAERGARPYPANAKKIADFYGVSVTDIWPAKERTAA